MTDQQLLEAVREAMKPFAEEMASLRDEVLLLNSRLGERALSIHEISALNGGRPSAQTVRRRVDAGLIEAAGRDPIRILYSEFKRAQAAGLL